MNQVTKWSLLPGIFLFVEYHDLWY